MMFASALCLLGLLGLGECVEPNLIVEGKVYCDTCRAQFVTKASVYMKDARVRLECSESEKGKVIYSAEAVTDATGTYRIPVSGEHEDDICAIELVKSSDPECSEINSEPYQKLSARISLTTNNGIASNVRQANPLGFLKKTPLPQCKDVLKQMGLTPEDLNN
ncbi:hypothetical protein CsatB_030943 [Cannabis sativa]